MGPLLAGLALLGASAAVVWWLLPRNGRPVSPVMRGGLVTDMTAFALVAGFAFGVAMVAAAVVLRP